MAKENECIPSQPKEATNGTNGTKEQRKSHGGAVRSEYQQAPTTPPPNRRWGRLIAQSNK